MAPIKKRTTMRNKVAASSKPRTAFASSTTSSADLNPSASEFSNTKKDKRAIKHNSLISRIEKSSKKPLKRRRPGKKLVTELEGLVDALPEIDGEWEDEEDDGTEAKGKGMGAKGLKSMVRVRKEGKMEMKTLKSRPGAAKRKAKLEEMEMKRFRDNMVGMTPVVGKGEGEAQGQGTTDRWAALRGFIGQTLDSNPAFGKKA